MQKGDAVGPGSQPSPAGTRRDIQERTLDYGVRAVRLFQALRLETDDASRIVGRQFLRAATSVGANVAEAQSAESKRDFVHKLHISLKEARESLYWLRLMDRSGLADPDRLALLLGETDELIAILVTIIRSARRNA